MKKLRMKQVWFLKTKRIWELKAHDKIKMSNNLKNDY